MQLGTMMQCVLAVGRKENGCWEVYFWRPACMTHSVGAHADMHILFINAA
jgi:hypothetical protein